LNSRCCWVDVWAYEQRLNTSLELWKEGRIISPDKDAVEFTENVIRSYQGDFLAGDFEYWIPPTRERIKKKILANISLINDHLQRKKLWTQAVQNYQKGLEIEPASEKFYQELIKCYLQQGLKAEAMQTYNQCVETLASILGTSPSRSTRELVLR